MICLALVMVYPLMHVIAISLSEPSYVDAGLVGWFPRGFNILGYKFILTSPGLARYYVNTIAYAVAGTFITLLFTAGMAYPLSIRDFMLKKFITIFIAITMFFSGGLIPTFLLIRSLGLLNTFWVMVLPGAVSAFNVVIYRTFFQRLPSELRESAIIDGANDIKIFFRIILPLSKPLLAVFALFSIVAHWNSWFTAMIYLRDVARHPIQMLVKKLIFEEQSLMAVHNKNEIALLVQERKVTPRNINMAVIVFTTAPILCIYPFIQKYFVTGLMIGSIKG